ncbi:uncharacterized protein JN550_006068 [Neoarthrinium moseri]|uniref:uncharacterized protein n=1 Tax=Neoarthrinium moseri TaxID=1658444 RepID=UPI001FDBA478|nr:uncharacterized protein JN550_006068 [Neoarthrinium moseri]KAI1869081.1 hypothetical protein JN550_006068 [Neoarthrinium moseri]
MTSSVRPHSATVRREWGQGIPPSLRPLVRAYVLGYATAVAPRLLTLVLRQYVTKRKPSLDRSVTQPSFLPSLLHIFREGLDVRRFPAFCALLVGGSTLLEIPLFALVSRLASRLPPLARRRLSRFFSTFCAAWLSLILLQSKQSDAFTERVLVEPEDAQPPQGQYQTIRYAGRTLDLTLFALTRALDVVVGEAWAQRHRRSGPRWTQLESTVSKLTDPTIFAISSGLVMWSWFYYPSKLPRAYSQWISTAAAVDPRLIEALRRCRKRELRYGEETGQAPLLQAMAKEYGWPLDWGDPAKSVPYPCEMVHMGCGPSLVNDHVLATQPATRSPDTEAEGAEKSPGLCSSVFGVPGSVHHVVLLRCLPDKDASGPPSDREGH